jgi:uncharacterized membrane protein
MHQLVTPGLLWCSAIGCGLMAGVYFAFATFIMTALARTGPGPGMAAMNAIDVEIVRSLFMPLFLATTLTSAALAVVACFRLGEPGAVATLAGGVIYVLGMFATMVFNVPLNDALAAADASSAEGGGALGALSRGLDLVEPRPDRRVGCGGCAVHDGAGGVLTQASESGRRCRIAVRWIVLRTIQPGDSTCPISMVL